MTESQREQVDELFGDLIERDPREWEAVLAGVEDAEVRAEVASLLDHTGPATKSLNTSIGEIMQAVSDAGAFDDRTVGPGTRFERYRIVRRIGQGGMGDVYEATRENDFHKRVALKIVRYGLDSDFARGRFQQERQVLAGLEHPYIARLLDGGEAANGCPYLVLEYVDGVSIDVYSQTRPRAEILKLFLKVCEAVEYAHRNLIIHRDLKPGNILVTAEGEPKLLDFGIAKLLDPSANVTQTMAVALTPQYASPEQIRGESISTASDVYSLGVILYQLLTGRKPYTVETTTAFELERVICQEPPEPPGIGNELDDILMMALRKEPERRYASVLELAQDIQRFQNGRAVHAAPDTLRYRYGKFIRRNKLAIAGVVALILTLTAGLASTIYQKRRAERRFEDVRSLAHVFLFDLQDKIRPLPGSTGARELVVTTALKYLDELSKEAGNDTSLLFELQRAYSRTGDVQGDPNGPSLGREEDALESYRRSARIGERLRASGNANLQVLDTLGAVYKQMGSILTAAGNPRDAIPMFQKCIEVIDPTRKFDKDAYRMTTRCYTGMADAKEASGDTQGAMESTAKALADEEAAAKDHPSIENPRALSVIHTQLGDDMVNRGDLTGALHQYQYSIGFMVPMLAREPELLARGYGFNRYQRTAGFAFAGAGSVTGSPARPNLGDPAGALPFFERSVQLMEASIVRDPNDASGRRTLCDTYNAFGPILAVIHPKRATEIYQKALSLGQNLIAAAPQDSRNKSLLAETHFRYAALLEQQGNSAAAADHRKQSLAIQSSLPPKDAASAASKTLLARTLISTHDPGSLQQALSLAEGLWKDHPEDLRMLWVLGDAYEAKGDAARRAKNVREAREWYIKSRDLWNTWPQHGVSSAFDVEHAKRATRLASEADGAAPTAP